MGNESDEQDRDEQETPPAARPTRRERREAREEGEARATRFSVERLRSGAGPGLVSRAYADADEDMPRHAAAAGTIAGALHDFDGDELTGTELRRAIEDYLGREDTTTATEA